MIKRTRLYQSAPIYRMDGLNVRHLSKEGADIINNHKRKVFASRQRDIQLRIDGLEEKKRRLLEQSKLTLTTQKHLRIKNELFSIENNLRKQYDLLAMEKRIEDRWIKISQCKAGHVAAFAGRKLVELISFTSLDAMHKEMVVDI